MKENSERKRMEYPLLVMILIRIRRILIKLVGFGSVLLSLVIWVEFLSSF